MCLVALVSGHSKQFHTFLSTRRDGALVTTTTATGSQQTAAKGVMGMCSASQDSLGILKSASASGISDITHCAQYAHDTAPSAVYVSFSASADTCMWFADCQCLASSSTCLGGDQWTSIAISDLIQPIPAAVPTVSGPATKGALVSANFSAGSVVTTVSDEDACDYSSSSLMQSFQSKCQMNQTMTFLRIVAGGVVLVVLLLVTASFGFAHYLDNLELAAIKAS